jgi:hypothetical protein
MRTQLTVRRCKRSHISQQKYWHKQGSARSAIYRVVCDSGTRQSARHVEKRLLLFSVLLFESPGMVMHIFVVWMGLFAGLVWAFSCTLLLSD